MRAYRVPGSVTPTLRPDRRRRMLVRRTRRLLQLVPFDLRTPSGRPLPYLNGGYHFPVASEAEGLARA
jgi:hypothetical protein